VDFNINDKNYRSGKMDAFKQLHVSRRLIPVLSGLAAASQSDGGAKDLSKMIVPLASAIASMPDADCDYILHACLSVVKIEQGTNKWAPIFVNGQMMFAEVDLAVMIQIAVKVIQDNLSGFFQGAAGALTLPTTPEAAA